MMTTTAIDANDDVDTDCTAGHTKAEIGQNAITLELAKKESTEHLCGMVDVYDEMQNRRPLRIKGYAIDDLSASSTDQSNVKVVHFVRHGQGFHNLIADLTITAGREWRQFDKNDANNPYVMPELLDAPLTEKGRQQAIALQVQVAAMSNKPQLVILSPNCRALQTGLLAFESLLESGNVPFFAHEMVREECGVHLCDQRRPVHRQSVEFAHVDFSLLESDVDPYISPDVRESKQQVADRIYKFMMWLSQRPEHHVAVATHSGWLLTLFNGVIQCDPALKGWFQTGEMRSVKLEFIMAKPT